MALWITRPWVTAENIRTGEKELRAFLSVKNMLTQYTNLDVKDVLMSGTGIYYEGIKYYVEENELNETRNLRHKEATR